MAPELTRRRLLAAGVVGGGALAANSVLSEPGVSFGGWSPVGESWPLPRYGPRNTGYNPDASPPRDGVSEAWRAETDIAATNLLVSGGYAITYGEEGLCVIAASDPESPQQEFTPVHAAGVTPPDEYVRQTVYAAGNVGYRPDGTAMGALRGWRIGENGLTGSTLWTTYEIGDNGGEPTALLPTADAVYVAHRPGTLAAFDPESGGVRWRDSGAAAALADGRLYASVENALVAHRPRDTLGRALSDGPGTAWTAGHDGQRVTPVPVYSEARVFVGGNGHREETPALRGYDAGTGDQLWDPLALGAYVDSPVVVGDVGYASVAKHGGDDPSSPFDHGELVAVNLADGSVEWRRTTEWRQEQVVAGGNVVVAYGRDPRDDSENSPGRVRAYDADSGDERWTFSTPTPADSAALVGDTVYVATRDGRVYALRAAA